MSLVIYSQCRIRFVPWDRHQDERSYPENSLIELRQRNFGDYYLQANSGEKGKEEIFNISFTKRDHFQSGQSKDEADQVPDANGRFLVWLNSQSRKQFHDALETCLVEIQCLSSELPQASGTTSPSQRRASSSHRSPSPSRRSVSPSRRTVSPLRRNPSPPRRTVSPPRRTRNPSPSFNTTNTRSTNEKPSESKQENIDILLDVRQLSKYIKEGNVDAATAITEKLARLNAQLQAKPATTLPDEQGFRVKISVESNNENFNKQFKDLTMTVFPSTTVRDIFTALKYAYKIPYPNQYIFVNGHLAYENSTMVDLSAQNDTLFILFVIYK